MTTAVNTKHKKVDWFYQVNERDYKEYNALEEQLENEWMGNIAIESLKSGLVWQERSKALLDDMKKACW